MTSNKTFEQIAAVNLSTVANIATALTVLTAVVFGLIEMRRARKEREERAAFVAVQAILRPAWIGSTVHSDDDAALKTVAELVEQDLDA